MCHLPFFCFSSARTTTARIDKVVTDGTFTSTVMISPTWSVDRQPAEPTESSYWFEIDADGVSSF